MSKKPKIHVVEIDQPDGTTATFYVRDTTPAAARNWLLDNKVRSRVASQDDVLDMVGQGAKPIGPHESVEPDPNAPVQQDLVGSATGSTFDPGE